MSTIFKHPPTPSLTPTSEYYLCALTLLCSRAPLSPRGEILHIPGTLFIFVCLFCFLSDDRVSVAATQRIPLDHLPLEARVGEGLAFLGTMELWKSERQILSDPLSQGTIQIADWNTLPGFLRKRLICLSRRFGLSDRIWFDKLTEV